MSVELWTTVDQFITDLLVPSDPVLDAALQSSVAAGLSHRSTSRRIKGSCCTSSRACAGRNGFLRSGPSVATARSGWRGRCRRAAASSRWSFIPSMPRWRARFSLFRRIDRDRLTCGSGAPLHPCCRHSPQKAGDPSILSSSMPTRSAPRIYFELGAQAFPALYGDHRGQRRAQRRGGRSPPSADASVQGIRRFNAPAGAAPAARERHRAADGGQQGLRRLCPRTRRLDCPTAMMTWPALSLKDPWSQRARPEALRVIVNRAQALTNARACRMRQPGIVAEGAIGTRLAMVEVSAARPRPRARPPAYRLSAGEMPRVGVSACKRQNATCKFPVPTL